LRRAEVGIHHHIAGAYLLSYAQESSWREDNRRVSNGDQVSRPQMSLRRVLVVRKFHQVKIARQKIASDRLRSA
jgi:hypothetical protein